MSQLQFKPYVDQTGRRGISRFSDFHGLGPSAPPLSALERDEVWSGMQASAASPQGRRDWLAAAVPLLILLCAAGVLVYFAGLMVSLIVGAALLTAVISGLYWILDNTPVF